MKDKVALVKKCAGDYGRRCQSVGEGCCIRYLLNAMKHPEFNKRHHRLIDELAEEYRLSMLVTKRSPFLRIPVSEYRKYRTIDRLKKAVSAAGHEIEDNWAILENKIIHRISEDIEIIDITVAELGYPDGCTNAQILETIAKCNLEPCQLEDALLTLIGFTNQTRKYDLLVMFIIYHDKSVKLRYYIFVFEDGSRLRPVFYSGPEGFLQGDVRLLFRRKSILAPLP